MYNILDAKFGRRNGWAFLPHSISVLPTQRTNTAPDDFETSLHEGLTAGGGLLADRGVEAEARAHALLPLAAYAFALLDLSERGAERFAT